MATCQGIYILFVLCFLCGIMGKPRSLVMTPLAEIGRSGLNWLASLPTGSDYQRLKGHGISRCLQELRVADVVGDQLSRSRTSSQGDGGAMVMVVVVVSSALAVGTQGRCGFSGRTNSIPKSSGRKACLRAAVVLSHMADQA